MRAFHPSSCPGTDTEDQRVTSTQFWPSPLQAYHRLGFARGPQLACPLAADTWGRRRRPPKTVATVPRMPLGWRTAATTPAAPTAFPQVWAAAAQATMTKTQRGRSLRVTPLRASAAWRTGSTEAPGHEQRGSRHAVGRPNIRRGSLPPEAHWRRFAALVGQLQRAPVPLLAGQGPAVPAVLSGSSLMMPTACGCLEAPAHCAIAGRSVRCCAPPPQVWEVRRGRQTATPRIRCKRPGGPSANSALPSQTPWGSADHTVPGLCGAQHQACATPSGGPNTYEAAFCCT